MGNGRLVTVLGFIDPHVVNKQGKVTCVSIQSDQARYVIVPRGKGRALTRLVDAEAQVSGMVRIINDVRYLDVLSYEGVCYDPPEDENGRGYWGNRGGF